jgi:Rrf2 family protein
MLTRKATYGIRALASLARGGGRPQSVAELAESEGIPQKFLAGILTDLRQRGIVQGQRGRVGGYWLAVAPEAISIARVVEILSGPVFPFPCLDRRNGSERCRQCPGPEACPARNALEGASVAAYEALRSLSLADVIQGSRPAPP